MIQFEVLSIVVQALDAAGVPHMVAGSFASTYHSEPRMTRDIDLVIDPTTQTIALFVEELDRARFFVDDAVGAVRRRDMFNVIDISSGWKVDLIVRKDRPFSVGELERRVPATIGGVRTYVASLEDTMLAKLEWMKMSDSEWQRGDVTAMVRQSRQIMDVEYLNHWAGQLGIEDELASILKEDG